jgi:hypothetical protein
MGHPAGSRRAGFSCGHSIFDVLLSRFVGNLGWGPILMEIVLALIIGLAVACVVFILGAGICWIGTRFRADAAPAGTFDFRQRGSS